MELFVLVQNNFIAIPKTLIFMMPTKLSNYIIVSEHKPNPKFPTAPPVYLYRANVPIKFNGQQQLYYMFPRFCATNLCKDGFYKPSQVVYLPKMLPAIGAAQHFIFKPDFKLMEYQQLIVEYLISKIFITEAVAKCKASCILQLEPGGGKTFIAGALIEKIFGARPGSKILYVVKNTELRAQIIRDFGNIFEAASLQISTDLSKIEDCNLCIVIVNTLMDESVSATWCADFDMTIYDEVHEFSSDKRKEIFWKSKSPVTIGMTAEPCSRLDMRDRVIWDHLGEIIYEDQLEEIIGCVPKVDFNGETIICNYRNPAEFYKKISKTKNLETVNYLSTTRECLCNDPDRNNYLANIIVTSYNEGRPIIAGTHHVEHVIEITELIKARLKIMPTVLLGGGKSREYTKQLDIDAAIEFAGGAIVIGTYSFLSTGISRKELVSLLFMVYPYKPKQICGRILRPNPENPAANLIVRKYFLPRDGIPFFKKHYENVLRYLEFKNFSPVAVQKLEESVNYDEIFDY